MLEEVIGGGTWGEGRGWDGKEEEREETDKFVEDCVGYYGADEGKVSSMPLGGKSGRLTG